jgi:hypothetical protein
VITVSWRDRNVFKGGEHLSISGYTGSDVQISGTFKGYNTIRFGGEINFSIPRVLVPFGDFGSKGGYMPRTNIQLGYDMLDRVNLYSLNSFRVAYGYLWKESMQKQHELYPIRVNFVEPGKITENIKPKFTRIRCWPVLYKNNLFLALPTSLITINWQMDCCETMLITLMALSTCQEI